MPGMGKTLLPALLIGGLSVGARAQQPSCDVDEGTPAQVARAVLSIQIAQSTTKPEDVAATIAALSQPAVQFVSGSGIFVDGGEDVIG